MDRSMELGTARTATTTATMDSMEPCRICHQTGGEMIRACGCGPVHRVCLEWARTAPLPRAFTHCPSCFTAYRLALVVQREDPAARRCMARLALLRSVLG